jgi:phosphoribosylamine--glycine ligase
VKVMLIGSGGREHALAWKLAQSPRLGELIAVPGNPGMAQLGECVSAPLTPEALLEVARRVRPDLTVVGPEAPLVVGLADRFEAEGFAVVGPSQRAAQLEGSKRFAKAFMTRHGIPTARYRSFVALAEALAYVGEVDAPIVVKDSGLAAGKGVTVARTPEEAQAALRAIFAAPNAEVVVEEVLYGQEVSLLVLTDGEAALPLVLAQDYKQAWDGDQGPMTGGMGAVAPVPLLTLEQQAQVMARIVQPTLRGLAAEGSLYRGVLYVGLMVTEEGPKVLEYNVRFGDPETQAVLPLLEDDLLELFVALCEGRLAMRSLRWLEQVAVCVVMAAPGYPGDYPTGVRLALPDHFGEGVVVFHAGTRLEGKQLLSASGRVLNVTALGNSLADARARAYETVAAIDFPGAHYRRDLGWRLVGSLAQ